MNGYLRSKCSSEQQLLNELAKLLAAKDVASRKMGDVLRGLTLFYTSAARGSRIPQSLLSGLCSLLPQLKDKKEIALLKDEHQRIARLALCLLARLIDQFEIQKAQTMGEQTAADHVLSTFLSTLETTVMTPPGLLLPRQRATLRVYAQLCRIFRKRDQLVSYTVTLLQQSPVLADNQVDVKGKRAPPPGPAQLGAVAGACHSLRFHAAPGEQLLALDKLVQLAFTAPAGTASRHGAKTLLSLLTSTTLNEDRPSNAVTTAKAIELFLIKARPRSLFGGDSLTSVLLLRLCGQMYRLPVHQQQQQQQVVLTNDSGGSALDAKVLETSPSSSQQLSPDQNPALQGFTASNALSAQLQEYLMDVIQSADGSSAKPTVNPAVLLVAVEEVLRGTAAEACFTKHPNWGSKCVFELVAAALLSLLPVSRETVKPVGTTVMLHRVCRAVQFVAERLDATVLQLNASSGQSMPSPAYLSQLTLRIRTLTEHSNAFVACNAVFSSINELLDFQCAPTDSAAADSLVVKQSTSIPSTFTNSAVASPLESTGNFCVGPQPVFGGSGTADDGVAGTVSGRTESFSAETLHAATTATTATTVSTTEEASFSTDFGAPADFSPPTDFSAPENFTAPADLSTPADGPAFDGGVEAERDVSFGGEAQPVFGGSGTADDGVAGTVSGRTESFSAETLHAATTATTATTVSTTEEASFSTDFGAPADFSPPTDFSAPENFTAPADLSTPADGPAFDGGVEAERDVSFGGEAQPVFGGSGTADDGVAGTVSGRTESFSAETLHAATTATTATTVSTTEEASFSTDFGAPADFSPPTDFSAPENFTAPADLSTPADGPAFDGGVEAERDVSFGGEAQPVFGGSGTADDGVAGTVSGRTESFSAETLHAATTATTATTVSTTEEASFSTDFGAPADFSPPTDFSAPENFTAPADLSTPADGPAFDGGVEAERDVSFGGEAQPVFGGSGTADDGVAGTVSGRTESFSAETLHAATTATTATTVSTTEEASFSTDFGAPADFSPPTDFSAPENFTAPADLSTPADGPAFDGGVEAERDVSFGGEAQPVFGGSGTADDGVAGTVSGRTESFSAETLHAATTATTATTVSTTEEASFSTDFGAPADFSPPTDFSAPENFTAPADLSTPADGPAFDGGVEAERDVSFGGEAQPVFGGSGTADDGVAGTVSGRTESFSAETLHAATTATTATTVSTTEEASFSTDFGAPADFSPPTDFSAPENFTAPADLSTPADGPAFDGGVEAERDVSFGGEAQPVFGGSGTADDGVAGTVSGRTESFSAETLHAATTATTATTVSTTEEASFSTDFGAPADFSPPTDFSAPENFTAPADLSTPADGPAFDGGVEAERDVSFGGEAQPVFGGSGTADDGVAGTVSGRTESFSAETLHAATTATTATTVSTTEEASFSTDFGAPADFSPPTDFSAPENFTAPADLSTPADGPAFDGGVEAERDVSFGGEAQPVFGGSGTADDGVAGTVSGRTESFSAETLHAATTATTATTVSTTEEASFSTDFGAPADFSPPTDFSAPENFTAPADLSTPADGPAFDGGVEAERDVSFGGEAQPVFGGSGTADDGVAGTVSGRTESFSAETLHAATTATTATTVSTTEEASFSTDFGAPADFSPPTDFSAPENFTAPADLSTPADGPAFDGGVEAERDVSFGGEAQPVFGGSGTADDGVAGTVSGRTESFSAETLHAATTATTATTVSTTEEASFSTDFGAPADFSPPTDFSAPENFTAPADLSTPADGPAFDGGVEAERDVSFGGEAQPVFGGSGTADDGVAGTVSGRTESFSAETLHAATTATTATTVSTTEEASFSTDFGAPADFSPPTDFSAPENFTAPADLSTPADGPAFDGGVEAERDVSFGGEAQPVFGGSGTADDGVAGTVSGRTESFSAETLHAATTATTATTVSTTEEASFSTDFGAPADFSPPTDFSAPENFTAPADLSTPADGPAFDGGVEAERDVSFGGEAQPVFGGSGTADDGVAGTVSGRTESFSAETLHAATTATTATTVSTTEEASFSTDFGAPADFSPPTDFSAPENFTAPADLSTPADGPAFDGGVEAERDVSFGGEAQPVFGGSGTADDGVAGTVSGRTESFSAETLHAATTATTATTVSTTEEASFSTDFGAPADFSPPTDFSAPENFTAPADLSTPADGPAFDGGVEAERDVSFGGEAQPVFGGSGTADDGVAGTVSGRTESFSAETLHAATTATTATTVSTTEEASFSTDFGAPADFSPPTDFSAPENFTAPADLSTPADGPAFDGGVEAERDVSFGGEAQPVFGGSGTADDGVAGTVSGRTESFSAETLHAATTATTATTVSTTEEASFSTDFGAPADFSPPTDFSAPENFTAPADLSTPADGPAFDGGVEAERDVSFGGEAQPVFGGSGTADDGVAGTVSGRTESFSAETLHAATTATTATTVSTTEEASFSTDFGAPADFSPPTDFSAPENFTAPADLSTPADGPAFDGGVEAERDVSFGGEAQPVFGGSGTADDGVAGTVSGRTESFSAETLHAATTATTATTVSTTEEASFSTDFGAPADFSPPTDFSAPENFTAPADLSTPADGPAFDGGVEAERDVSFGGEAQPVFGGSGTADDGVAGTVSGRTESFSAETLHAATTATTATTVSTTEEASFSTDFGAPADFSPPTDFSAPENFTAPADLSTPADGPAFDGGVEAERDVSFGGEAQPVFGGSGTADDGVAGTVSGRTESFSAETLHAATTATTATTVSTTEEASFSTDFGAPADFSPPTDFSAPENFTAPADLSTPADGPAFDGGVEAERDVSFGGEAQPVFGGSGTADDGVAGTVSGRTESFSAETLHAATTATTATTVSTTEEASFSTDFGAPADFSPPTDFSAPENFTAPADLSTPADGPAFDGGVEAERDVSFGGEAQPVFGGSGTADDGVAGTVSGRTESFSAETLHAATTATTATTVSTTEEASFSTDFGAPADFSPPTDFSAPENFTAPADLSTPADGPAFDGGVEAERDVSFGGEAQPVFGGSGTADDGVAGTVSGRTESFSAETLHAATTATTATTVSTTEEASFSTDFGAPADFSPPTDFSAPENFTAPADLSTPADGPAFDGGVEAERDVSFGGEAQPVFGGSGTADDGVAGTVSGRTESFSAETLHAATTATTATTVSTTEEASFSTDFGAPADFSPPTDFSAPENFTAPADLSTPADGPAFDGGVEAERDVSFGGEAQPVFGGSGTADDGVAGTVSGRTESFSAETLHAATTATTVSTTEEASFSTDFGAPVSVNCVDDAGAGTTVLNRIEMDSFHPGMVESAENQALRVESGSVAGGDFTFDVDEYDEAGGKPLKYFSETNEYEVSTVLNSTPCTHVSEKQSTDGRLDDEFDEIFGDTSATQSEMVSSVEVTTSSGKYDADFDDIFGESQTESGSATNSEAFVASAAESNGDSAASTEGAAIEKKHNILDNEDQTAPGVEVRTGTPASDFTFR
ncbi:hypothetical protein PRIC2_012806 [Phytophthora ramorum]